LNHETVDLRNDRKIAQLLDKTYLKGKTLEKEKLFINTQMMPDKKLCAG
jgi:hypothetical protein